MKVLLIGATGMVGGEALRLCLAEPRITEVLSISRRLTGLQDPKLKELLHQNYLDFSALEAELKGVGLCLYCLGVYQNDVSAEDFWKITCDYQDALVKVLERASPELTFCLFGAQGADPTEKSWFRFAKAKGRAEASLLKSKFPKKFIFRPGYIHPTKPRGKPKSFERLFPPIYRLFPGTGIDSRDLASVMLRVGLEGSGRTVFENRDIREEAGV